MAAGTRRGWAEGRVARAVAVVVCAGAVLFVAVPQACLTRARSLIDARRHDTAGRWSRLAELSSVRRGAVHFHAARLARRRGDFTEAQRRLLAARDAGWPIADLEREQWIALAQTGQVAMMQEHWPALFGDPGSDGPEISRAFVVAALARIRLADARRVLEAWESDYPEDPGPHLLQGLVHAILLESDAAAAAYARALERDPRSVEARRGLAKRLRFAEASEAWSVLLAAPFGLADVLLVREWDSQMSLPLPALGAVNGGVRDTAGATVRGGDDEGT